MIAKSLIAFLLIVMAGCSSLSQSKTPALNIPIPSNYKNATNQNYGVKSNWWAGFQDSRLNKLQSRLLSQNKDLTVALANYERSLATLGVTRAELYPQVTGSASSLRNRDSESDRFPITQNPYNVYQVNAQLGYEVDLWGRVRSLVKAGKADSRMAAASLADVRVALQTQLARDYFALRFLDAEAAIVRNSIQTRKEALTLANDRFKNGISNELDSTRAQSLLASAQAELIALEAPRARLENAIAVLIGQNASQFRIPIRKTAPNALPSIPAGVPAGLLSRRPDVAAAEHKLIASSARLGVAKTEPFPKLRLTGSGGFSSISANSFLQSSSNIFSIGPSVDFSLFSGGRFRGNLKRAQATQKADLATFQQTALQAFAEVESALTAVSSLKRESAVRKTAVSASRKSYNLAKMRYDAGADTYLTVIDSQRELLSAERLAIQTRGRQFSATLQLIQALGGGFNRTVK